MTKTHADALTVAVGKTIAAAPVTLRELARRAGVSHALLHRIVHGMVRCTPRVADAVVKALEGIAAVAQSGARTVKLARTRGTR
jgi:predicted transcriptional regulator